MTWPPVFTIPPNRDALIRDLEATQRIYEQAKRAEIDTTIELARCKRQEPFIWEAAVRDSRLPARSAAEKAAAVDKDWLAYEAVKGKLEDDKRGAERDHSIAYQRVETLRTVLRAMTGATP